MPDFVVLEHYFAKWGVTWGWGTSTP